MVNAAEHSKTQTPPITKIRPVLGEFFPFEVLWLQQELPPLFNSEGAARWFFRNNRVRLVRAEATIIHTGRVLVHPARVSAVAEAVALRSAQKRAGEPSE